MKSPVSQRLTATALLVLTSATAAVVMSAALIFAFGPSAADAG
jgi:hypothetical protein